MQGRGRRYRAVRRLMMWKRRYRSSRRVAQGWFLGRFHERPIVSDVRMAGMPRQPFSYATPLMYKSANWHTLRTADNTWNDHGSTKALRTFYAEGRYGAQPHRCFANVPVSIERRFAD